MDHGRPQETSQSKGSMVWHREHSDDSADKRQSDGSMKSPAQDEKRPFRRVRSPSRPRAWISTSYKPRFGGRFHRPRFLRDEHSFRKPGFGLQRYHHFTHRSHFHPRDHPLPKPQYPAKREKEREWEKERERVREDRNEQRENTDTSSPPKENTTAWGPLFPRCASSRERDKQFTVPQESERNQSRERDHKGAKGKERERSRDREPHSAASQTAARNRAIQHKRREIEEVYRQDCDTFGVVVRMLIAKDPSLERPIQSSLQENLREIGLRCVEAMEKFIEDYDSGELSH
ncbi:uncharacterized protein LOC139928310 [Centroberyx gerrardi]|uniref:uncharacterized protein n=1 Tax=Centroberyx gerrardi TaxID=166262 RepID=UPI003AB0652D